MDYDIVIIGAGPAGLFAAHKLIEHNDKKILLVDKGKEADKRKCFEVTEGYCFNCSFCDLMHGVGGSGLFSDGKLNLDPCIGGDLTEFTKTYDEAMDIVDYVDKIFLKYGAPKKINHNAKHTEDLVIRSAKAGIKFIPIRQRHIGSDELPKVITKLMNYLKKAGVDFALSHDVLDIVCNKKGIFEIKLKKKTITSQFVLIAPGRIGADWIDTLAQKLNVNVKYNPIDVGVRVEVPDVIMSQTTSINWDPKFHIRTPTHDDFVRTFCTCPSGFVVEERYKDFVLVNGHSMRHQKSTNTNFAFLTQLGLTEPVENTLAYGRSIAKLATTIGGGKPIVQRLNDLRRGRRSTDSRIRRSYVKRTFIGATPGDISMALPSRIVTAITEGLEKLDGVIPGVASDSTLLYAPEIKFHAMRVEVDHSMESSLKNLFIAGDGAGVSRGIVGAAATGVLAAQGILQKQKRR